MKWLWKGPLIPFAVVGALLWIFLGIFLIILPGGIISIGMDVLGEDGDEFFDRVERLYLEPKSVLGPAFRGAVVKIRQQFNA